MKKIKHLYRGVIVVACIALIGGIVSDRSDYLIYTSILCLMASGFELIRKVLKRILSELEEIKKVGSN